jgi:uncharacterized protein with PIN domain
VGSGEVERSHACADLNREILTAPAVKALDWNVARIFRGASWHVDCVRDERTFTLEVPPGLRPLLYSRRRTSPITVVDDCVSTIGHVIGSVGIPLTEVGELTANGTPVSASWRPTPGAVVTLLERARPQAAPTEPPRFILDVHLGTLARRMRLLGIDAQWRNAATDDELIVLAARERRVILTRDRGLLLRRAARDGAYVRGDDPESQLEDVLDRFAPPLAPWSRCLTCNGLLEPAAKSDVIDKLQPGTRRTYESFARCAGCGRVYWEGAHHPRLTEIVAKATARQTRSFT